MLQLLIIISLE